MMKKIILMLIGTVSILGAVQASAEAAQTVAWGVDTLGDAHWLPQNVCILPGQGVRIAVDNQYINGGRTFAPLEFFSFRMATPDGRFAQWSPRMSQGYGPFQRGWEYQTVYVFAPYDMGAVASVTVSSVGHARYVFRLVNVQQYTDPANPAPCRWASGSIYLGGW
jgi:hypothetical protein